MQPIARLARGRDVVDLEGRLAHDPAGRTSGRLGVGYRGLDADRPMAIRLRGGVDQDWAKGRERHVLGGDLDWAPLGLGGSVYSEVAIDDAGAPRDGHLRLDGYTIDAEARLPYWSWARVRARRFWRAEDGDPVSGDDLSLRLQPFAPLRLETGTSGGSDRERDWFARIRIKLELGGSD